MNNVLQLRTELSHFQTSVSRDRIAAAHLSLMRRWLRFPVKQSTQAAPRHGPNGGGGIGPALAGRESDYIVGRLTAYRANEMVGAQSALMWGQAAALSDDDIRDLAEYVTSF